MAKLSKNAALRRRQAPPADHSVRPAPAPKHLWLPQSSTAKALFWSALLAAFILRVINLKSMFPILVDESIYLRWAEIIDHQGQWFISLLDGKQPFTYWILALIRKISAADPLVEGRLASVLAGIGSTIGIYGVTRHLTLKLSTPRKAEVGGAIAACLYACFPYALLYDRLAYTEAFVNLFGILIVWSSLVCFDSSERSLRRAALAGLVLGLALFTKQTALLFAFIPALAALLFERGRGVKLWRDVAVIYALAALFPLASIAFTPEAPMLATHDAVLHHTGFFVKPADLLADPFRVAGSNFAKLLSYTTVYLTAPLSLAGLLSFGFLIHRRCRAAWLVASASVLPLVVEVFVLELMFPTRYPFPHYWPWLSLTAAAAIPACDSLRAAWPPARARAAVLAVVLLIAGPLLWRSLSMLAVPRQGLHPEDETNFLGSSAHAGFGVEPAIEFLKRESAKGPFILLTDPIWGPPADAMFPYLNRRYGIQVYEAWWTQLSGTHAILPQGNAEVLRSHYERTKAGSVEFSQAQRVFYVTDTNYYPPPAVQVRQPGARRVASFPKPGGKHSVDIYQLK